jgi:tetratricopeptide (TPR) repeat protein
MSQKPPTLSQAVQLWKAKRRDEARRAFTAITQTEPSNEQAWLWLARTSQSPEDQFAALQRVLTLNPGNEVAQRVLAERFPQRLSADHERITELLGDAAFADQWWQAEALYMEVLTLDPAQPDALDGLLHHHAETKNWHVGMQVLQEAHLSRETDESLTRRMIDFAIQSRDTDLLRQLDKVLLNHPAVTVEQLLKAGEIFATARQYGVVVYLLERASGIEPANQTVLFGLASAYGAEGRHKEAKAIRQRITDVDRSSTLGQRMMTHLLDEDPYVPLSMRRNTLVAVREAVGLALPIILLVFFDNGLSFLGADRLLGIVLALGGGYLLVTATSSHEQAIWQRLVPDGLDNTLRAAIGAVGTLLLVVALYFSLRTSFDNSSDIEAWEHEACTELVDLVQRDFAFTENELTQSDPCEWLRDQFYTWETEG